MKKMHVLVGWAFAVCAATAALAQVVIVDSVIPDNDANGLISTLGVNLPAIAIQDVTVTLNISSASGLGNSAWNGDFYAYLTHESGTSSGFAVLLNRPGRTTSNPAGYSDSGFSITLSGSALNDVHNYQDFSPSFDAAGRLIGNWQADGRNIVPTSSGSAFDSASRTATLSSFEGLDPNGLWVLFISDRGAGNEAILDSWALTITPVPEPKQYALVVGFALLATALGRRLRRAKR